MNRRFIIILIGVLILFNVLVGYRVWRFPQDILAGINMADGNYYSTAYNIAGSVFGLLAADFLFVCFLLTYILTSESKRQQERIVYVEKYTQDNRSIEAENIEETQQQQLAELDNWLAQALAERKPEKFFYKLCNQMHACAGVLYEVKDGSESRYAEYTVGYAFKPVDQQLLRFEVGDGLVGQVVLTGKPSMVNPLPDGYLKAVSGLGDVTPPNLLIIPFANEFGVVKAVVEVASFSPYTQQDMLYAQSITPLVINYLAKK